MTDYKRQGKRNRVKGAALERRVRADLEKRGWTVTKWMNTIRWHEDNINKPPEKRTGEIRSALSNKFFVRTSGFPDFVAFKRKGKRFLVIGVEAKLNGYLDPEEREKVKWYLRNKTFSKFYVGKKGLKRGQITYTECLEKKDV